MSAGRAADDTHPCVDCHKSYADRIGGYWLAPEDLWAVVVGRPIALCPECFADRARAAGVVLRWEVTPETNLTEEVTMDATALMRERDEALGKLDQITTWAIATRKSGGHAQTQQFLYSTSDLLGVERFLRLEEAANA